jgi:hypothetical protein
MALGSAVAVTDGFGFTVSSTVADPVQPLLSVPVTLYVVVAVGQTLMVVPESVPGCHE